MVKALRHGLRNSRGRFIPLSGFSATNPNVPRRLAIAAAISALSLFSFPAKAQSAHDSAPKTGQAWAPFIEEAAARFAIPARWIRAVIQIESKGNPKALSPKGAVGLMQLKPDTYAELRARYALGDDPTDPHDNIIAGTAYLHDMRERFGPAGFIAAYNAGPRRYQDHLATGAPLPDETLAYVAELAPMLSDVPNTSNYVTAVQNGPGQRSSLFVMQRSDGADANNFAFAAPSEGLSIAHRIADLSAMVPLSGGLFVRKSKTSEKP
jgi:soluble lytic murein transglycosylase-like protein